uniref:WD_REPEATS_REGION domain-containing protein n=1 Tax=Heterorhabditis bacteriophora TaxID=37862 RepID=A0A1I7XK53_HETBA
MTPIKWKAHDGLVLCCDWSSAADLIVTGGEDCKFKWSHSMEKLSTGSILALAWSPDGTQLVGGCAAGHVIHAHLIEKRVTYRNLEVVQTKQNIIEVRDVSSDVARERLETRDRVTRISIGYEYVVTITTGYIYIFSSKNWNTPAIVDLKERSVLMVLQSDKIFLIADSDVLLVYSYEGKSLCELKIPGSGLGRISKNYYTALYFEMISSALLNTIIDSGEKTVSLSKDTVAVRDRGDHNIIHLFDPITAKVQGDGKIIHDQEISELAVCQCGLIGDRMVAFRDKSGNVFLAVVKTYGVTQRTAKIGSLVEQLQFNDETNMLAGVADGRLVVWPVPSIVFTDRSLLQQTMIEKIVGNLGKFPLLLNFTENTLVLRKSDGSLIPTMISPFPAALLQYSGQSKWDQAIRMCRQMKVFSDSFTELLDKMSPHGSISNLCIESSVFLKLILKDDILWAMLAGLATQSKNLYAAEIAYGALEEGEKVSFLFQARSHQNRDVRNAMLILFGGKINRSINTETKVADRRNKKRIKRTSEESGNIDSAERSDNTTPMLILRSKE